MGGSIQTRTRIADIAMAKRTLYPTESQEQIAIFDWARIMEGMHPELKLLHAIPNGGLRNLSTARRLKREGVKAGVPDICLPVSRGAYKGLYIELKTITGKLTFEQRQWICALSLQGYEALVCFGSEQAIDHILEYITRSK
jgi:hypothetical protein